MGYKPERVTTDGHDPYPRAIRTVLGRTVRHRTNAYDATDRFYREHSELRNFLCPRCCHNQPVAVFLRRFRFAGAPALRLGSCRTRNPAGFPRRTIGTWAQELTEPDHAERVTRHVLTEKK